MAELTLVEAVNDAFHVELERDPDVMVMGEDVGRAGGVFRATAGLRDRFGADRCVDTPLAEAGILGSAVGLCMAGWRPVCEMQYDAFSYPCLDQLITHVGRYRWRTGGAMEFPLVVRMPYGGGVRAPELHDDSPEAYYVHTPGVKVAIPSTPADAKGLLAAAIRDPDPVVVLEPKLHYRTMRGEVPEGEHVVAARGRPDRARGRRRDLRRLRGDGAARRAGRRCCSTASVEILDIRSLKPLDEDALLAAAAKTGRVVIVQEAPRVGRLRRRAGGDPGREGDARPAGAGRARDGLRRPVPVLADRGRVHAVGRARRGRGAEAARVLKAPPPYRIETERLVVRCWEPRDAPLLKEAVDSSLEHLRPWMPWAHDEPQPLEEKVELLRELPRALRPRPGLRLRDLLAPTSRRRSAAPACTRAGGEGVFEIGYWIRASRAGEGLCDRGHRGADAGRLRGLRARADRDPRRPGERGEPGDPAQARLRRGGDAARASCTGPTGRRGSSDAVVFALLRGEFERDVELKAYDAAGERVL